MLIPPEINLALETCYQDSLAALHQGLRVSNPNAHLVAQLKLFAEIGICDSAAAPRSQAEMSKKIDARLLPIFMKMGHYVVNDVLEPGIAESYTHHHGDGFVKCSHEAAEDSLKRMLLEYLQHKSQRSAHVSSKGNAL